MSRRTKFFSTVIAVLCLLLGFVLFIVWPEFSDGEDVARLEALAISRTQTVRSKGVYPWMIGSIEVRYKFRKDDPRLLKYVEDHAEVNTLPPRAQEITHALRFPENIEGHQIQVGVIDPSLSWGFVVLRPSRFARFKSMVSSWFDR